MLLEAGVGSLAWRLLVLGQRFQPFLQFPSCWPEGAAYFLSQKKHSGY